MSMLCLLHEPYLPPYNRSMSSPCVVSRDPPCHHASLALVPHRPLHIWQPAKKHHQPATHQRLHADTWQLQRQSGRVILLISTSRSVRAIVAIFNNGTSPWARGRATHAHKQILSSSVGIVYTVLALPTTLSPHLWEENHTHTRTQVSGFIN